MEVKDSSCFVSEVMVRCTVLCDFPAGQKLCGFLGHSAKLGCSKCYKEFPGSVGVMNYSGFDRNEWLTSA